MTVKELIAQLKTFPQDWPVHVPEISFEALPSVEATDVSQGWDYASGRYEKKVEIN